MPSLLRRNTTNHASAELQRLFYMESTLNLCQDKGGRTHKPNNITYSLSGETLAEDLGILVDEEVGYGRVVITASRRLRERPAPGCLDGME